MLLTMTAFSRLTCSQIPNPSYDSISQTAQSNCRSTDVYTNYRGLRAVFLRTKSTSQYADLLINYKHELAWKFATTAHTKNYLVADYWKFENF